MIGRARLSQLTRMTDAKGQVVKLIIINIGHLQSSKHGADRLPKQIHLFIRHCCEGPALLQRE